MAEPGRLPGPQPLVAAGASGGRIAYFDNLKYLLIVLVVVGHYIDPFATTFPVYAPLFGFIYLFHMPLFVFCTGLFAQGLVRTDGGFRVARVFHFLVLFLALYTGICALETLNGGTSSYTPWRVGNASWYLLACAIWYLFIPALDRLARGRPRTRTGVLAALVVVVLAAGYFPAVGDFLSLSRVVCFAPFFFGGFWASRDRVATITDRDGRWKAAAVAVLAAALAAFSVFPFLLKVRGILTARNPYSVLHGYAAYGAGFRLVWLLGAVVLGGAVLLLVPRGRHWFTRWGERTLPIYFWHLLGLRLLALVAFIPLVRSWHLVTGLAVAVPLLTGLVAAHLFGLKPPFGVVSDRLLKVGRGVVLPARAALATSVAALVAVPVSAFAVSDGPLTIPLPRGLTPWIRPAPPPPPTDPPLSPPAMTTPALLPGRFELPLAGATGFVVVPTVLEAANGLPGGELRPGDPYTIRRDDGDSWLVETADGGGRLPAATQVVNLVDLVPSISYPRAAPFTSSGVPLPVTSDVRPGVGENGRLGGEWPFLPVSYPTAVRLQQAQQAARAQGDTLILHDAFRPAARQRELARALLELYATDERVRAGIEPWPPSDFAPLVLSNHSLGVAVDLSLGRIASSTVRDGPAGRFTVLDAVEYPMPTPVHELSRAAAGLSRPVRTVDGTESLEVPPAPTLTEAATRLRGYLVDAGFAPSASAWWEFTDWHSRQLIPAASSGDFTPRRSP